MTNLISVIVAVYNAEKYLDRCIESILNQSYDYFELLLIDDGSTDGSGRICDDYEKKDLRIKVIHQENSGQGCAMNKLLDIVNGKWIAFVDCDDWVEKDYLEFLMNTATEYAADIAICGYHRVRNNEIVSSVNADGRIEILQRDEAVKEIIYDEKIHSMQWQMLFRKELWNNVRFIPGQIYDDVSTVFKTFLKANKVVINAQPKYYYLQRFDSIMGQNSLESNIQHIDALKEQYDIVVSLYSELEHHLRNQITKYALSTYKQCILTEGIANTERKWHLQAIIQDVNHCGKFFSKIIYGLYLSKIYRWLYFIVKQKKQ